MIDARMVANCLALALLLGLEAVSQHEGKKAYEAMGLNAALVPPSPNRAHVPLILLDSRQQFKLT